MWKKSAVALLLLFFACNAYAEEKTEVIIIGCIHKKHGESKLYTTDILKDIVLKCQPDALLLEMFWKKRITPKDIESNKNLKKYIDEKNNEIYVAYEIAKEKKIPLLTFDAPGLPQWKGRHSNKSLEEECFARMKKFADKNKIFQSIFQTYLFATKTKRRYSFKEPDIINSSYYDNIVRIDRKLYFDAIKHLTLESDFFKDLHEYIVLYDNHYIKRNDTMVANIVREAKAFPGKRMVVLVGAEHRYYLRDKLSQETSIDLKEYWELEAFE